MVAKCGNVRIWHWAHQRGRVCDDHWWKNETEWHRAWKEQFPVQWQEVLHRAENGDRHIADVKTDQGWVLEFQNSYIKPEERRSREIFYQKMIWVVNGARRIRDRKQFVSAWEAGVRVADNSSVRRVLSHECALLRDWAGGAAFVLFDFGEQEQVLWWLLPQSSDRSTPVVPFSRADFIRIHRGGTTDIPDQFDGLANKARELAAAYELQLRVKPFQGVPQFLPRKARFRRRL
jgi:hypothetical protein